MLGLLTPSRSAVAGFALALVALTACGSTVDRLGYEPTDAGEDADADADTDAEAGVDDGGQDGGEGGADAGTTPDPTLTPLTGPSEYPNLFRDLLGKTEQEITDKINEAYRQLFMGNPDTEAIYYEVDATQGEIRDILHNDVRTEGLGLGMLINVQLDNFAPDPAKKEVFDKLWTRAKTGKASTGASAGYFDSWCDAPDGTKSVCVDPFGYQQFAMALVFAHDLWGSDGAIDYEADALALFEVMLEKQEQNGGIVDDVLNTFDAETQLVFSVPNVSASGVTRPSLEMPAYYDLWAQATGNSFWLEAAASARAYLQRVAHPTTGLTPARATFSAQPLAEGGTFTSEAYRVHFNVTLDFIWSGTTPWPTTESDRLIGFFDGLPDNYGGTFELDGTPRDPNRDLGLVCANGIAAVPATNAARTAFVQEVWDLPTPNGQLRYYAGLLDLLSLLTLSGRMRVI